jgi:hypothetical protein
MENVVAEISSTTANAPAPVAAAPVGRRLTIHHFTFHGEASLDGLAAFAATKVLLESDCRATSRETDHRATGAARPDLGHYVIRFMTGSRSAMHEDDFPKIEGAKKAVLVTVRLPKKRGPDPAASCEESARTSTFRFRVVNGSLADRVSARPGRPTEMP